ncbi:MAG: hypothetical protein V9G13_08030 [Marmoricola sp.]
MSKNKKTNHRRRERRVRIREDLRREPDVQKIANTVIALAMAQAEKEAQLQQEEPTVAEGADDA